MKEPWIIQITEAWIILSLTFWPWPSKKTSCAFWDRFHLSKLFNEFTIQSYMLTTDTVKDINEKVGLRDISEIRIMFILSIKMLLSEHVIMQYSYIISFSRLSNFSLICLKECMSFE